MLIFLAGFLIGFVAGCTAIISIGRRLRRSQHARQPSQQTVAQQHKAVEAGIAAAKWTRASWPRDRAWPEA
jgi:hypothetical protein